MNSYNIKKNVRYAFIYSNIEIILTVEYLRIILVCLQYLFEFYLFQWPRSNLEVLPLVIYKLPVFSH
uniref:Uncharacterized protein n=1 Tax=Arundo donax TaxID=35708 RepID=A0A0A9C405_ARUDO